MIGKHENMMQNCSLTGGARAAISSMTGGAESPPRFPASSEARENPPSAPRFVLCWAPQAQNEPWAWSPPSSPPRSGGQAQSAPRHLRGLAPEAQVACWTHPTVRRPRSASRPLMGTSMAASWISGIRRSSSTSRNDKDFLRLVDNMDGARNHLFDPDEIPSWLKPTWISHND